MILVYGATGFTGRLIVEALARRGLAFEVAGRGEDVVSLGASLGVAARRFSVDAPRLEGARVLLNCAGPFVRTAVPLARAAIAAGVPYLDLAGEAEEHAALRALHGEAAARGVMLLPGVGFGVVATEPLAAEAIRRHGGVVDALTLAYVTDGEASRGTLATVLPALGRPGIQHVGGVDVAAWPGAGRVRVPLGPGGAPVDAVGNPWRADLASIPFVYGVPTVEVFAGFPRALRALMATRGLMASGLGRAVVRRLIATASTGPDDTRRAAGRVAAIATARGGGHEATASMEGPEAYVFTARAAAGLAARVLEGARRPGFITPARLVGLAALTSIDGVRLDPEVARTTQEGMQR